MKISIRWFCGVLCLLLHLVCGHAAAAGAERTVRVGFFSFAGFQETLEDGHRDGYGYQYLQRIARITGWKYEYVDASWSECLGMLERGEIDILGSVQRTPDRERRFAFPKLESGVSYVVLYTKADNTTLPYEDFAAFEGIRVGLLRATAATTPCAATATGTASPSARSCTTRNSGLWTPLTAGRSTPS